MDGPGLDILPPRGSASLFFRFNGTILVIPARIVERSRILLLLADGAGIRPTADQLQVGYNTVRRWRDRFLEAGCRGIEQDAPGRGRKPVITAERKAEIVRR